MCVYYTIYYYSFYFIVLSLEQQLNSVCLHSVSTVDCVLWNKKNKKCVCGEKELSVCVHYLISVQQLQIVDKQLLHTRTHTEIIKVVKSF